MLKLNFSPPSNRICVTIDSSEAPSAIVNFHSAACFVLDGHPTSQPRLQPIFEAIPLLLTFWRSDTPLFPIFNCQRLHAMADPLSVRMSEWTIQRPGFQFPRDPPPLRALLIPRAALFPCTQNALLRAAGVRITDVIRGCKLSWKDRSWYQFSYKKNFSLVYTKEPKILHEFMT